MYNPLDQLKKTLCLNEQKDIKIMRKISNPKVQCFMYSKINKAVEKLDVHHIVRILKNNFDNMICEIIFGTKFDEEEIKKTLENREYICFLIKSHLLNRACNLGNEECSAFKIRLYYSIVTFIKYQKN